MSGKVTQGPKQVVKKTALDAASAPKPPPKTSEPAPQLNERTLRRTGKASGFTKTFTPLPSSPQASVASDVPVMRAGSASTLQQLQQTGGQLPTSPEELARAEAAVAFNPGHTAEWSMAELKKDPKKFLRNVVQLDGSLRSTVDRSACGPTALLMGMIAGRPESLQDLASKLVDARGNFTKAGASFASKLSEGAREDLHDAVVRLREGKRFSASDVTQVADSMQGVETRAGLAPDDLRDAAKAIEQLGVKVPPLELQLFGDPDGSMGHWRVVSSGTQFNPWPNSKGQSTQVPAKDGQADGTRDGTGWVRREQVAVGSK